MGRLRNKLWLVALGPVLVIFLASLPAGAVPVVRVEPSLSTPSVGSLFDLFVEVSSVTDLYAFQFGIRFNPAILSGVSVIEGSFLPSGGDTSFVPGSIDNKAGTISSTLDSLFDMISGVSGNGILAILRFQALAVGTSLIDLPEVMLLDSRLADISSSAEGGTINAVPEPQTIILFGSPLMILIRLKEKSGKRSPLNLRKGSSS
jgi:hypothetical protein